MYAFKIASLEWDYHRLFWLDNHAEVEFVLSVKQSSTLLLTFLLNEQISSCLVNWLILRGLHGNSLVQLNFDWDLQVVCDLH